ncbi:MAG: formylglycine-generating enzyme family protein, partial [Pseudomonadota bacterium]|nr:formylglycine-generating enzyme family protein [Pseudomonadota bacterium]
MIKHTLAAALAASLLLSGNYAAARNTPDSEMVSVPAAEFEMGCNPATDFVCSYVPEEQLHKVYVDAFKIDKYEVTTRRYSACIEAGVCSVPTMGGLMHYGADDSERLPINGVSWYQAVEFCKWEGKRLPTSAEWELAA